MTGELAFSDNIVCMEGEKAERRNKERQSLVRVFRVAHLNPTALKMAKATKIRVKIGFLHRERGKPPTTVFSRHLAFICVFHERKGEGRPPPSSAD